MNEILQRVRRVDPEVNRVISEELAAIAGGDSPRYEEVVLTLDRPLDEEALEHLHSETALAYGNLRKAEAEWVDAAEEAKSLKKQVEELQSKLNDLTARWVMRTHSVEVPCTRIYSYSTGRLLVVDMETGELIKHRELTQVERQAALEFDVPSGIPS